MRIVGYVRVSTVRQVEEGVSLEMQKMMIEKHVRMLELIGEEEEIVYYVDDGYSSSSLERPAMKELLEQIKMKNIDIIFAYRFDRISRDILDSKVFLDLLQKYGVKLKCLKDEVRTKTAGDRFGTNVKIVANQYEREVIVERTNDGLRSIAENGRYPCGGAVLLGYIRGTDKQIYINKDTEWIIREIFHMAQNGECLKDIAKSISEKTKVRKFDSNVIEKIIRDKRYTGVFTYKEQEYLNIIPPIISKEDQELAIRNYAKNYTAKSQKYYLFNIVYCTCGTKLTCTHSINHLGNKYYYYHCSNCKCSIPQKKLLESLLIKTERKISNLQKEKSIRKQIRNIEKRIKRVQENYILENYSDNEYCFLIVPLDLELQELKVQLKTFSKKVISKESFFLMTDKEKRIYMKSLYQRVIVSVKSKKIVDIILAN